MSIDQNARPEDGQDAVPAKTPIPESPGDGRDEDSTPSAAGRLTVLAVAGAALACIPLALIVYWPHLGDYFVRDDFQVLRVARDKSVWVVVYRAFTFPDFATFDEITLAWRPLTDLYFYAARIFGLHPEPYHAVNVVLHGMVGGLTVIFVWRLTSSVASGVVTGLLFTVAPTYDFAVTWISQGSEMFGAVLILGAFLAYREYLVSREPRRLYAIVTGLLAAMALLTKESTVMMLVLLPALAWALPPGQRRRSPREIGWSLAPVAALVGGYVLFIAIRESTQGGGGYELGAHMWRNLRDYLEWMMYPRDREANEAARTLGTVAFAAAVLAAFTLRQRALAFFGLWTIVALLPFTGFSIGIELRYTYLATLPFAAFVVTWTVMLLKTLPRPGMFALGAALTALVLVALVVTPLRTRDQQAFLAGEAAAYEAMVQNVLELCGERPPGSHVFVLRGPYGDLFLRHTQAALNLYYTNINAARADEMPPLAGLIEDKCVIEYQQETGRYLRTE